MNFSTFLSLEHNFAKGARSTLVIKFLQLLNGNSQLINSLKLCARTLSNYYTHINKWKAYLQLGK
jgi:hypothetical protein